MLKTTASSLPTKAATRSSSVRWSAVVPRSDRDDPQEMGQSSTVRSTGGPHVAIQSSAKPR